jgi:hypothetical protein
MTSASRQAANQQQAAERLQQHPGERLRVEEIARAAGLTNQEASIALCGLMNGGLLPGLTRPGRGTYQWDPPAAPAELVRIRWETVAFHTADVPRQDVPAEILSGRRFRGDLVETFLGRVTARDLSREIGDDGGTIVEIEAL